MLDGLLKLGKLPLLRFVGVPLMVPGALFAMV
jgi:hypothetical protein